METVCSAIKLKPGSLERVREWATTLHQTRRDEALATLRDESVLVESVFLWQREDGDYLVYYMRADSLSRASEAVAHSPHPIDAYHQQFKRDTWESGQGLELLVDLDTIQEARH